MTSTSHSLSSRELSSLSPALAQLFSAHQQRANRYAYWILRNQSDSEEVVQEAFVRLLQREKKSSGALDENGFVGLLFTTIRNLAIDWVRKNQRRAQVTMRKEHEPVVDTSEQTRWQELDEAIWRHMETLPDSWKEALKLRTVGELSYDEIAKVLGCTVPQVRTWIFRGRKQLAAALVEAGWLQGELDA